MARTKVTLAGETIGALTLDAGITTGLAWGTYKLEGDSFYSMCKDGLKKTIDFNLGDEVDNAELVAQQWLDCVFQWNLEGVPVNRQYFVYEKWIPNIRKFSMDESFASSLSLYKIVVGMLYKHEPRYLAIQPAETHAVTNKQLREHGLWIPIKERNGDHRLDVIRQTIQALRKLHSTAK